MRETALSEQSWPQGWAEEDCSLPIAMAFLHPHLDSDKVAHIFPAQDLSGKTPLEFWQDTAISMAERYDSLRPCLPYLQTAKAQQKLRI